MSNAGRAGHGAERTGQAWQARPGEALRGIARHGRLGTAGLGAVRCGTARQARPGTVRLGEARRSIAQTATGERGINGRKFS